LATVLLLVPSRSQTCHECEGSVGIIHLEKTTLELTDVNCSLIPGSREFQENTSKLS